MVSCLLTLINSCIEEARKHNKEEEERRNTLNNQAEDTSERESLAMTKTVAKWGLKLDLIPPDDVFNHGIL